MMTGAPTPVPVGCGAFVTFHPSYGSVVSWSRGTRNDLPAYISTPQMSRSGGPNFLGGKHAPFIIQGSPNSNDFRVRDVQLPPDISSGRAQTRQQLRASLDRLQRFADKAAEDPAVNFDSYYQQGINLVTSQQAQEAFDLPILSTRTQTPSGRGPGEPSGVDVSTPGQAGPPAAMDDPPALAAASPVHSWLSAPLLG